MQEIILNVKGMMCTGCENRIQNALKTIDEVEEVKANHKDGKVKINLKDDIDINNIKEKINDIGFEVVE